MAQQLEPEDTEQRQREPRVYISCHPELRTKVFPAENILERLNGDGLSESPRQVERRTSLNISQIRGPQNVCYGTTDQRHVYLSTTLVAIAMC